jgi:hypothetical protein
MKEEYTHQITDIGWQGEEPSKLKPYIKVRELGSGGNPNNTEVKIFPEYLLNWQLSKEKYCPGDLLGPCPYNNRIDFKYERCPACEKNVGFKAAFLFGEEPNERMKEHLSQDHFIYLAYFAPDIIKVGTAAASRKYIRLIEQDALQAIFIARASGFSIQDLEHAISRELGITEMVKSKQKYQFIKYRQDVDKAREAIAREYQKVVDRFKGSKFESWILSTDPRTDLIDLSSTSSLIIPDIDTEIVRVRQPEIVSGNFLGLRGKYLLSEYDDLLITLKITSLIGRMFYTPNDTLRYTIQKQEQLALF